MRCYCCKKQVLIDDAEPCFRRPDIWLSMSEAARAGSKGNDDLYVIRADGGARYFIRAVAPFAVHGAERPIRWGIWVEVSQDAFRRVVDLWTSVSQHLEPAMDATVANQIPGYSSTVDMPCTLQLRSVTERPSVALLSDHQFSVEQRSGVTACRAQGWIDLMQRGASSDSLV